MNILLVPIIAFATIFVAALGVLKAIRRQKQQTLLIFGVDGLIALWITTLVFLVFALIGWFSAPNVKYEIIKNIAYISFLITALLHIVYIRTTKKRTNPE